MDWSLDAGLYVMLSVPHDLYWVRTISADHDGVPARFNALWSQIVPRFRDYPNTLMLASINELAFECLRRKHELRASRCAAHIVCADATRLYHGGQSASTPLAGGSHRLAITVADQQPRHTGLGTNWVNVSSSTQTNQVTVPVNPANGAVFFRLLRP